MPLAEMVRRGLAAEGYAVQVTHDGSSGLGRRRHRPPRRHRARHHAARPSGYRVLERLRAAGNWTPCSCSPPRTASTTRPTPSTWAPTTTWSSRSRSSCCWPGCGRCSAGRGDRRPAVLQVGDLRLDPARHRVHRGDTEITLTPREFGVLEHLMRHAGEVVTKTDILARVWDAALRGRRQHRRGLRRLPAAQDRRAVRAARVETLRGVGYRMADPTAGDALTRREPGLGDAARRPHARPRQRQPHPEQRPPTASTTSTAVGAATTSATIASPSPAPPSARARASSRRTNRSNTRAALVGGTPGPSSATSSAACRAGRPHRAPPPASGRAGRRCRRGCAPPARAAPGRRRPARARPRSAATIRPGRPQPLGLATSSRSTSSHRGRSPRSSARASSSSASTSRPSRAVSPRRASTASRSAPPAARAPAAPGPVAIVASGLRSSWLASATNRRWTAWPACSRASIAFMVSASRPTSSRAGRHRHPHREVAGVGGDPRPDRLDRPQRAPGGQVGDDAGDQHQQRDPDQHQVEDGRRRRRARPSSGCAA